MSLQPLAELRRLLAAPAPTHGRVVRVQTGRVQVATANGLVTAIPATPLAPGQSVTLSGGIAYPKATALHVYPL